MTMTPTFDDLCADANATREEREALAHHLAGIRYRETLKLIDPPITRAAKVAAEFAKDGKVSVVRGKHLLRVSPNVEMTHANTNKGQSHER